jgi:hypothetical protein
MTPLLAAPLLVVFGCMATAQQKKAPATPLEGVWREPLQMGGKAADKLTVSIKGERITLTLEGTKFEGTIRGEDEHGYERFLFKVAQPPKEGERLTLTLSGQCILQDGIVYLRVDPPLRVVTRNQPVKQGYGPASITFQLEKLKK